MYERVNIQLDYKFEEKPQFRFYTVMTVKKLLHGIKTWVSRERDTRRILAEVRL
jgi:hypothetical protein